MAKIHEETKKTNKLQWFFFVIDVPIIFAITILLIILTIVGVNPFQKIQEFGSKVPIISSFISDEDDGDKRMEISQLEASVRNQEAIINDLESMIQSKDNELEQLQEKIVLLQEQLEQREENNAS